MALADDVALHIPAATLVQLTNPRDGHAPTSVGTAKLTRACSRVTYWFAIYAGAEYDSSQPIHVDIAVDGVVALLRKWGGSSKGWAQTTWDQFKEACAELAEVSTRARPEPATNSELTPSDENPSGTTVRPWSDPSRFRGILPSPSSSADVDADL